jgi:hypothetical protein
MISDMGISDLTFIFLKIDITQMPTPDRLNYKQIKGFANKDNLAVLLQRRIQ